MMHLLLSGGTAPAVRGLHQSSALFVHYHIKRCLRVCFLTRPVPVFPLAKSFHNGSRTILLTVSIHPHFTAQHPPGAEGQFCTPTNGLLTRVCKPETSARKSIKSVGEGGKIGQVLNWHAPRVELLLRIFMLTTDVFFNAIFDRRDKKKWARARH